MIEMIYFFVSTLMFGFSLGVMFTHISYGVYFHRYWVEKVEKLTTEANRIVDKLGTILETKNIFEGIFNGMMGPMMMSMTKGYR